MNENVRHKLESAMVVDGGGFEIIEETPSLLYLALLGSCMFCPNRSQSAKALGQRIKALLPQRVIVEANGETLFYSS